MNRTINQLVLGGAPAPGAADDALVAGILRRTTNVIYPRAVRSVRREGAPNCSRGGCAPHFQIHDYENQN